MPAQTLANTVSALIPFLQPLATTVVTLSRTSPDTAAKVQTAMEGVTTGITALADSETAAQSQPIVARIEADAQAVLAAAAVMPLPPPYGIILQIAASLLPAVFSSVNLLMVHRVTVTAAPAAAAA